MRAVSGDAGSAGDIVEGEGGDERVDLHEQRERLADATGRTEDGHLPLRVGRGGVVPAAEELGRGFQHRPHCSRRWGWTCWESGGLTGGLRRGGGR